MKYIFLSTLLLFLAGCKGKTTENASDSFLQPTQSNAPIHTNERLYNTENNNSHFNDGGDYEAEVEYYNPNTGTYSTYILKVNVENGELTHIYFPNGGWLDDSHFTPVDISSGEASFTTDKGYHFTVKLLDDIDSENGEDGSQNTDNEETDTSDEEDNDDN